MACGVSSGVRVILRRAALLAAGGVAIAVLACGCGGREEGPAAPAKRAPRSPAVDRICAGAKGANLIVIVLDAARADHFGLHGYHRDTTPEIDGLLARSIVFEKAYCQAPNTKASVTSLFTSLFPDTHGVIGMFVAVPAEVPTLAEALKADGYRTVCFSANPFLSSEFGFGRGFDEFHEIFREVDLEANQFGEVPAELLGKAAVSWFQEHRDERFYAYLHFLEPHAPYTPPEPFRSKYEGGSRVEQMMAFYDGNLAYADSVVGEVTAQLEQLGLLDKSVVVLLADHGEAFGEHGRFQHSDTAYEETARVPLAVRLPPACEAEPQRRSEIISIVDLMPTLLELLDVSCEAPVQGRSRLGLLAGEEEANPSYAVTRSRGTDPSGGLQHPEEVVYALTTPQYTLILGDAGQRVELYDRESDPGQQHNIAAQQVDVTRELQQQFEEWASTQTARPVVLQGGGAFVSEEPPVQPDERTREQLKALGYLK